MNAARQIVRILRKDIRAHWPEIAGVLSLNALLVIACIESWGNGIPAEESPGLRVVVHLFLPVAWVLLIARVVQGDAPSGRSQYWLVRPYSRPALLASKIVFVLAFVHVPTFVAQIVIVTASGLPLSFWALIVNQIVIAGFLCLPTAVIASITQTLSRFLLVAIPTAAFALYLTFTFLTRGGRSPESYLDTPWVRIATTLAAITLYAVTALAWQYSTRQTRRVAASCIGAPALVALTMLALPSSFVQWVESIAVGPPSVTHDVAYRPSAEKIRAFARGNEARQIRIPLQIADSQDVDFPYSRAFVRTQSGAEHEFQAGIERRDGILARVDVPPAFYNAEKDNPVTVRLVIHVQSYETHAGEIPRTGAGIVNGRDQCAFDQWDRLICRSSFHRPLLSGGDMEPVVLTRPTGSVGFAIDPIARTYRMQVYGDVLTPFPTVTRVPSGYERQTLEIEDIRLGDWDR